MEMKMNISNLNEYIGIPNPVSREDFERVDKEKAEFENYGALLSSYAGNHIINRRNPKIRPYFSNVSSVKEALEEWVKSTNKRMKSYRKTYTVFEDLIFWVDSTGDIYCSSDVKKIRAVLRRKLYRRRAFRVPFSEEGSEFRKNIYNDLNTGLLTWCLF